jgi:hypothetical protein
MLSLSFAIAFSAALGALGDPFSVHMDTNVKLIPFRLELAFAIWTYIR